MKGFEAWLYKKEMIPNREFRELSFSNSYPKGPF